MKKNLMKTLLLGAIFLWGCGREERPQIYNEEIQPVSMTKGTETVSEEAVIIAEKIVVYVCGAVQSPGLYEIEAGARAGHAIVLAGGMTDNARKDAINLARVVSDGEQIRVPYEGEDIDASMGETLSDSGGKVNLNTANAEQLMTLPGIGQAKADSIIAYRETHGAFQSIEDLMNIEGIKEGVFGKIKDSICIK